MYKGLLKVNPLKENDRIIEITSPTLRGLKIKASQIANGYHKTIQYLFVYENEQFLGGFSRINSVCPNNQFTPGKWY